MILLSEAHCSTSPYRQVTPPADTSRVASLNGEWIILCEFMLQARSQRTIIINYFRNRYGVEYSNDFWSGKIDGTTPMDVLKKKVLDTLVQIKVQQICARNAGLIADISYEAFLKALETENQRRSSAKASGRIIYGPVRYTEEVYYNYLFTNLVNRLKEYLAGTVFKITEEKLKEVYDKEKDSLYRKGFVTIVALKKLRPFKNAVSDDNAQTGTDAENTLVFNDSVYSPEEGDPFRSMVRETSSKLAKGQSSKKIEFGGNCYIVTVKEKTSLGFRSYDQCKSLVRNLLTGRMYENYIRDLVKKATCETNMDVYENIQF